MRPGSIRPHGETEGIVSGLSCKLVVEGASELTPSTVILLRDIGGEAGIELGVSTVYGWIRQEEILIEHDLSAELEFTLGNRRAYEDGILPCWIVPLQVRLQVSGVESLRCF